MANRLFTYTQALEKEMKALHFKLTLSAAAAVVTLEGLGATVAKTGTGEYTFTLQDRYNVLLSAQITKQEAVTTDMKPMIESETVNSTTPTVVVKTEEAGTDTDVGAVTVLYLTLHLKNTSLNT